MFTLSEYLLSSNEDSLKLGLQLLMYQDEDILEDFKIFAMSNNKVSNICYQLNLITIADDVKDRFFVVCDILHDFSGVRIGDLPTEWVVHRISFEYKILNIKFTDAHESMKSIDFRLRTMFGRIYNGGRSIFDCILDCASYKQKVFVEPFIFANESVVVLFNHEKQPFMMFSNIGEFQCYSKPKHCKIKYHYDGYSRLFKMSEILDCLHHGCVFGYKPNEFMITEPYSHVKEAVIVSKF